MYMFIVLGRLGCKQVICLGYVYVLWLYLHDCTHTRCAGKVARFHDHPILAQALCLILIESYLKNNTFVSIHFPEVTRLVICLRTHAFVVASMKEINASEKIAPTARLDTNQDK